MHELNFDKCGMIEVVPGDGSGYELPPCTNKPTHNYKDGQRLVCATCAQGLRREGFECIALDEILCYIVRVDLRTGRMLDKYQVTTALDAQKKVRQLNQELGHDFEDLKQGALILDPYQRTFFATWRNGVPLEHSL